MNAMTTIPFGDPPATSAAVARWYMLLTKPQMEFAAEADLRRRGLRAVAPCRIEYRWRNRYERGRREKKKPKRLSLMPGYVAVHLAEPVNWYAILGPDAPIGIRGVVGWDGRPRPIPASQADQFESMSVVAPEAQAWMQTGEEFAAGDTVKVAFGPLGGQIGKVERVSGKKATILIERFGGQVASEIETYGLARAG